jgi:hypothetical protein
MNSNQTIENLTAEEVEIIRVAREREEASRKEESLRKEKEREKNIENAKHAIRTELSRNERYVQAVKGFYEEFEKNFPGEFELKKEDDVEGFKECFDYVLDAKGSIQQDNDGKYVVDRYFKEKYKLKSYVIRYPAIDSVRIYVSEHVVRSRYSYHGSNKGFKMRVHGLADYREENKYLTSVKTVKRKLGEKIERDEFIRQHAEISSGAILFLKEHVMKNYGQQVQSITEVGSSTVEVKFKNSMNASFSASHHFEKIKKYEVYISKIDTSNLNQENALTMLMLVKERKDDYGY